MWSTKTQSMLVIVYGEEPCGRFEEMMGIAKKIEENRKKGPSSILTMDKGVLSPSCKPEKDNINLFSKKEQSIEDLNNIEISSNDGKIESIFCFFKNDDTQKNFFKKQTKAIKNIINNHKVHFYIALEKNKHNNLFFETLRKFKKTNAIIETGLCTACRKHRLNIQEQIERICQKTLIKKDSHSKT